MKTLFQTIFKKFMILLPDTCLHKVDPQQKFCHMAQQYVIFEQKIEQHTLLVI
jgi:hypothetical protein